MNKIIIGTLSFLIIATLSIGAYILIRNKPQTTNPPVNTSGNFKPLPSPAIPSGNSITLATNSGNVTAKNFIKTAVKIQDSSVYVKENSNYVIIYVSDGNNFLINLFAYNSDQAQIFRSEAENSFLSALGVSRTDACKLEVHLRVPASYNDALSDTDYHLSFCPNAVPLP